MLSSFGLRWNISPLHVTLMARFQFQRQALTGQSGTLYFQKQSDEDSISSDMIQWYNFCHESSSIFVNRGWQHPILVLAMEGSPADKAKWCKYESELVRRERF
jgi:hypothetical protein